MTALVKRYRVLLALLCLNAVLFALEPETGRASVEITRDNLVEMLSFLPPILTLTLIGCLVEFAQNSSSLLLR